VCALFSLAGLAALVVAIFGTFAPGIAGTLASGALGQAGVTGTDTQVNVVSDPPTELLEGRADRVEIRSTSATIGGLQAETVDLALLDVSLANRTWGRIEGRLGGVTLQAADGSLVRAEQVDLAGPPDATVATVRVAGDVVEALALEAVRRNTGLTISDVTLVEPDLVTIGAFGIGVQGRLVVEPDGWLALAVALPGEPRVPLFTPDPLRLQTVAVSGGGLVLTGTIDLAGLLE
jgi:hypothetical protein